MLAASVRVMMKAAVASETSVGINQSTGSYNLEGSTVHTRRRENLKSLYVNLASFPKVASCLSRDWYHRPRRWQQEGPRPPVLLGNRPLDHEFSTGQVTITDSCRNSMHGKISSTRTERSTSFRSTQSSQTRYSVILLLQTF